MKKGCSCISSLRSSKRAQASIEYLLIMGFMLLLLTPLILLYASSQNTTTDALTGAHVERAARSMRDASERVYFAGAPAQETITIYIPSNVRNATIQNVTIVYTVASASGDYNVLAIGLAPMNGTLPITAGTHRVQLLATSSFVQITPS